MLAFEKFELVVCNDADGGLRLSPSGSLDDAGACQRLNEAIIGALRTGVIRLEVDLRDAESIGDAAGRVLRAGQSLARHLDVEFRITGVAEKPGPEGRPWST